ncbi:MAG: MipA/OmpV family protein, partial [Pseudomonadota bacterium]
MILIAVVAHRDAHGDELRVGIGAGVAPDFPGSGDYSPVPLPSLFYETDRFTIRTRGFGIEADVIPSRRIDFGPIIRFDTG